MTTYQTGYGSGGYGYGYSNLYSGVYGPEEEAEADPFSGSYNGSSGELFLDMEVDLDKLRKYSPVLNIVSGTVLDKAKTRKLWSGDSTAAHFRSLKGSVQVTSSDGKHEVKCPVSVTLSSDMKVSGQLSGTFQKSGPTWTGKITLKFGDKTVTINVSRTSEFFRDVYLDIDYTDKVVWPVVEVSNLPQKSKNMKDRKLDLFSAFEDAGIKVHYDEKKGTKVEDPSKDTPWTKSDLYDVMDDYFNEVEDADSNVWCMMGTVPPDKRYMGFSFDHKGKHGFALFTGHSTFTGYDSACAKTRALAQRRLLHYFVHECGHCLGLLHPFEHDNGDSLSWMNYAWRYDDSNGPGSFYKAFNFRFSDEELMIMRHSPGKNFRQAAERHVTRKVVESGYGSPSYPPDNTLADDSSDSDSEADGPEDVGYATRDPQKKPKRKLDLRMAFKDSYKKGELVDYEVRLKNVGSLPAMIDSDLTPEGGNLRLYVSDENGSVKSVDSYVRPIQSAYTKPRVLYTDEDDEGADRYSDYGSIGETRDGYLFKKPGTYTIKAQYSSGRYNVTTDSYTITIEDPVSPEEEEELVAVSRVTELAGIGGSSHERFKKNLAYFENLSKMPVEKKKSHVAAMVALFDGMSKPPERTTGYGTGAKRRKLTKPTKPARAPAVLLKDTDDLVSHYHEKGDAVDNQRYAKLTMVRASLYLRENKVKEADDEVNRLYGDLLDRRVKPQVLAELRKKFNKMKNPVPPKEKETPKYYQGKVSKVLDWIPKKKENGEKDLTGIGLGNMFSNFDPEHKRRAKVVSDMLFNKYEETQSISAVTKYADVLQKSREVNQMVVKYVLQVFLVHSADAKKAGVKYPEPKLKDKSLSSSAAMVRITDKDPAENRMDYWRCDADFNFHHSHWHAVYSYRNLGKLYMKKRGEMFAYMHSQMLARYDAERESWELEPVKPFQYDDKPDAFFAGLEFHSARGQQYAARKQGKLSSGQVNEFKVWEARYKEAVDQGGENQDANWAGRVLESAPLTMEENEIGNLHNMGHVAFMRMFDKSGPGDRKISYMGSSECAVRDPIFFRWHKRIEDLWQISNETRKTDLAEMAADVRIENSDIMISSTENPTWSSYDKQVVKTQLLEPIKEFELDNKLDHEKFYYHIRIKATDSRECTIRIFICPERQANNRTKWIEMDKFVQKVGKGTTEITRKDIHSSVIKRVFDQYEDAKEKNFAQMVSGFCECGWPYNMLLPRGKEAGEKYKLCVVVTDSEKDTIKSYTRCGSMSYCGAADMEYPDKCPLGYPFSTPLAGMQKKQSLVEFLSSRPNVAVSDFVIQNEITTKVVRPKPTVSMSLWPNSTAISTSGDFRPSKWVGTFRIVLYSEEIQAYASHIKLQFSGRGKGYGMYGVEWAEIALRVKETDKVDPSRRFPVTVGGKQNFTVDEAGITTDSVPLSLDPSLGDYFITFRLSSPGCYRKQSKSRTNSMVAFGTGNYNGNFGEFRATGKVRYTRSIYCIQNVGS